jgi:hypothetical protein
MNMLSRLNYKIDQSLNLFTAFPYHTVDDGVGVCFFTVHFRLSPGGPALMGFSGRHGAEGKARAKTSSLGTGRAVVPAAE